MIEVEESLKKYVEEQIFPIYDRVDEGHNLQNHIMPVIEQSLLLAQKLSLREINLNVVFVVAAYHDIGLIYGRKKHHLYSKEYVLQDKNLKRWFSEEEILLIAEAVEEHRASSKEKPHSIYGMIISDCDKNVDLQEIIWRTHLCIRTKFPEIDLSTFEKEFDKAYEWILEKDSEDGYLTFYLDKEKQRKLAELHKQVVDRAFVKKIYYKVYNNHLYDK